MAKNRSIYDGRQSIRIIIYYRRAQPIFAADRQPAGTFLGFPCWVVLTIMAVSSWPPAEKDVILMEMKKFFRPIKHLFNSPACQDCARPLDNVFFDIDGGKLVCPFCEAQNEPTELYNDSEIIGVSEILIPNDYERFLSNVGFRKKPVRRTPKIGLVFLILLMSLGAVIGVISSDFNIYLKLLLAPFAIWIVVSGIMRHYKDEEKPKWYREKITIGSSEREESLRR